MGLAAFQQNIPHIGEARARMETSAWRVSKTRFEQWRSRCPELIHRLLQNTAYKTAELEDRFHARHSLPLTGQLACQLCKLTLRFGTKHGTTRELTIRLTRQMLADLTGARVASVIRRLSRWETKGILHTRRGRMTICNIQRLRKRALPKCHQCLFRESSLTAPG